MWTNRELTIDLPENLSGRVEIVTIRKGEMLSMEGKVVLRKCMDYNEKNAQKTPTTSLVTAENV
jgi:hypothetical protein